jgi:YVTN family beta-propeller protein
MAVTNQPVGVAFRPDGAHAYIASYGNGGKLTILDVAAGRVIDEVAVESPWAMAVSADGLRLYVAPAGRAVEMVDTATNRVVGQLGDPGQGLVITPDGTRAYVARSGSVWVSAAYYQIGEWLAGSASLR